MLVLLQAVDYNRSRSRFGPQPGLIGSHLNMASNPAFQVRCDCYYQLFAFFS